jgi:hypothetical protein
MFESNFLLAIAPCGSLPSAALKQFACVVAVDHFFSFHAKQLLCFLQSVAAVAAPPLSPLAGQARTLGIPYFFAFSDPCRTWVCRVLQPSWSNGNILRRDRFFDDGAGR